MSRIINRKPLPSETVDFDCPYTAPKGQAEGHRYNGTLARAFLTAPGDAARCLVGGRKKGARECWLQSVEKPGPGRIEPACPHFGACGGCAFQHLDYRRQLELKCEPIVKLLRQQCPDFELLPPAPAPTPWYYRSKVEFSFLEDNLGFNRKGRFDLAVDVGECLIAPIVNRQVLSTVRSWVKANRELLCQGSAAPGWNTHKNCGFLRYLVLRQSSATKQFLCSLVTGDLPEEDSACAPLEEALQKLSGAIMGLGATGFIHAEQGSVASAIKPARVRVLRGQDSIVERLGPLEFNLNWQSFFQSNPPAFYNMLKTAAAWLRPARRILDLYCGVGTIGLSLVKANQGSSEHELTGVEYVPEAVTDARRNAQDAGIAADYHQGNSEDWPDLNCDCLIIDPPRSGCHPKLIKRLLKEGPWQVLYVSCNPARFAEEYTTLQEAYQIRRVQMFDFFPHTPHVECAVLLVRK